MNVSVDGAVLRLLARLMTALLTAASVAASAQTPLPKEVQQYVDRRESCDHWRGEPPFDAQRQNEINRNVCAACVGSDARLAALKRKYRSDPAVMAALAEFEERIEEPSPAAMAKSCRRAVRGATP